MTEKNSARDTRANALTSISYLFGFICKKSADYFEEAKDCLVDISETVMRGFVPDKKHVHSRPKQAAEEKSVAKKKKKVAKSHSKKNQKESLPVQLNDDFEKQIEQITKKIE